VRVRIRRRGERGLERCERKISFFLKRFERHPVRISIEVSKGVRCVREVKLARVRKANADVDS